MWSLIRPGPLEAEQDLAEPIDSERASRLMAYAEEFEDRWFWETDAAGRLTYLSKSVAEQVELFGTETVGSDLSSIFEINPGDPNYSRSLQFLTVSRSAFSQITVRARKGLSGGWWSMSGRPWFDDTTGEFCGFVGSGTDLTKLRKQEAMIRRMAVTDGLTGLANRLSMQETIDSWLATNTGGDRYAALMMLDLDGFKAVNDTLGHPVGDELFVEVGKRLSAIVGDIGIVGRLGGDEFQVFVPMARNEEFIADLASRIIAEISEPYDHAGQAICVSCSVGISLAGKNDLSPEVLVRNADIALYAAKDGGRATHRFFEEQMLVIARKRKELEDDLRFALNKDQLSLAYQPIVAVDTEKLVGFEALLRWEHPKRGLISPEEFIPVAEECSLIQMIGEWVLQTAVADLARLPEDLRIAVNISTIQFCNPDFLTTVAKVIASEQIDASRLELEITESVFLKDEASSRRIFKSLKALGVRLALDDFGTGYSSLAYLKSAPFDKIKIDKTFMQGATDPTSRNFAIIQAIAFLSHQMNMETTAEGVEYKDEIRTIKELGCSHIQGYVYGPGVRLDDLLPQLHGGSRKVRPYGHRRSGVRRVEGKPFAEIQVHDQVYRVKIGNHSSKGLLIEGIDWGDAIVGTVVQVVIDGETLDSHVRWAGYHCAGLEFISPDRLELAD